MSQSHHSFQANKLKTVTENSKLKKAIQIE